MKNEKIIACVAIGSLVLGIYNQWYIQQCPHLEELVNKGNGNFDNGEYKRAVKCYDDALKIHESDTYAWRNKGFALFNLGIDNESVCIKRYKGPQYGPPYSYYAKELIDYYNSFYQPNERSNDYFERSFQCFEKAVYHNPEGHEMWLYKGVVGLYLSPSPICNPVKDFNESIKLIDNLPNEQKSYPLRDIKSVALYGKCMAYQNYDKKKLHDPRGHLKENINKMIEESFSKLRGSALFYFLC